MRIIRNLLILATVLFFASCGKDEPRYAIPAAPVNFMINTSFLDNHLAAGVGNICIYIRTSDKANYDKLISGVRSVQTFNSERAGVSSLPGYSGLLVINTGSSFTSTPYAAFDLCCPNEGMRNIMVVPTDDGIARCPECGSTFDILNGSGIALSGEAMDKKKSLQSYYVTRESESEYRIFY